MKKAPSRKGSDLHNHLGDTSEGDVSRTVTLKLRVLTSNVSRYNHDIVSRQSSSVTHHLDESHASHLIPKPVIT